MRRRSFLLAGLALAACEARQKTQPAAAPTAPSGPPPPEGSLEWAAAGPWRIDPQRDVYRHPVETLRFWGLAPGQNVLEIYPGRGWWTAIVAPYLAKNGGAYIAASFDPASATPAQQQTLEAFRERFIGDPELYGSVQMTAVAGGAPMAPDGWADLVILARNVHTLMARGLAESVLADVARALKPGGVLGVEQHRAPASGLQDPQARDGYVQETYVKLLAEEAGLRFEASSEINANPKDDRDHPFGVWTLPPTLRTAPLDAAPNPNFDTAPYVAIGESDRMTLRFVKPGGGPQSKAKR